MEKACETCAKVFSINRYLFDVRRHCSKECKTKANRITLTCKFCSKEWETWKSQIAIKGRPGAGQYCSKLCVNKAKVIEKPQVEKPDKPIYYHCCETCDKTYRIPPSRVGKARFCSYPCKSASPEFSTENSERQRGEKSWRWTGGEHSTYEGYVRIKANKKAEQVATFEHRAVMINWILEKFKDHPFLLLVGDKYALRPDVEVHHIDRVRSNNARDNLLALTKSAHAKIHHRGTKPEAWECWPPNPIRW